MRLEEQVDLNPLKDERNEKNTGSWILRHEIKLWADFVIFKKITKIIYQ